MTLNHKEHLVFGLDIGTRSVVGTVGYMERNRFKVVAQCVKGHDTRAMIDGQIHDIAKVGEVIRFVKTELELKLGIELKEVCIAAAGRVLKTMNTHVVQEFPEETLLTTEHIYSLDMLGVEKAHEEINSISLEQQFYNVGYSVVKYYLNGYEMSSMEGHKARKIEADILSTFLPEEVVNGLYSSVKEAGLEVCSLTLEPIAAIQLAIPEQFRLLNIALVDVGAGTSDICITKSGSIVAYGMIPLAGDEITEKIVENYLVDFATAEKIKLACAKKKDIAYKDIMGLKHTVSPDEVHKVVESTVNRMTDEIAAKICELNGGKPVSAVFVVGGGGKIKGFTTSLSEALNIPDERVAIRGQEVMGTIDFEDTKIKKDALLVTPIGICLNFYNQKNSFIFVYFNGERLRMYDNGHLTVLDAAIQYGYSNEALFPRRGKELDFTIDGKQRVIRGGHGEGAVITINGEENNMQASISQNDRIIIRESTVGEDAKCTLEQLPEYKGSISFEVNGKTITCPKFTEVNGKLESGYYEIKSNDDVRLLNYYTVEQLMQFLDMPMDELEIKVNNVEAYGDEKVYENFRLDFKVKEYTYATLEEPEEEDLIKKEDKTEVKEQNFFDAQKEHEKKIALIKQIPGFENLSDAEIAKLNLYNVDISDIIEAGKMFTKPATEQTEASADVADSYNE
ncbi:MAG: rod shape-determining protein [Lachnospiraceae bacterium]|nr:rod shape-determining protein [Lachnospiraceae bacterium]